MKKHAHWKRIHWNHPVKARNAWSKALKTQRNLWPEMAVLTLVAAVLLGFSVTAHSADANTGATAWPAQNRKVAELHAAGRDAEALRAARQALETAEQQHGARSAETALSLNNLALIYKKQGDYSQAAALYQRSLDIARGLVAENDPDLLVTYNNLALTYEAMGKTGDADAIYREVRRRGHDRAADDMEARAKTMRAQGPATSR